jgi:hypothetical protein
VWQIAQEWEPAAAGHWVNKLMEEEERELM